MRLHGALAMRFAFRHSSIAIRRVAESTDAGRQRERAAPRSGPSSICLFIYNSSMNLGRDDLHASRTDAPEHLPNAYKEPGFTAARKPMDKEETLQRIKEAEEQVRRAKAASLEEKERVLRDARKEGFDLRESLRGRAEKRQDEILRASEASIAREKEALLAKGRQEAEGLRSEALANVERAVDRLIDKFKGALNA